MELFSIRFKEERKNKGLTQEQLAKEFFLNKSSISRYEKGTQMPEMVMLQKFAEYFDVSVDYLLGRTDERNTKSNNIEEENDIEKIIDELMEQQGLMLCGEPISKEDMILLRNSIRSTIELAKTMQNKK